MLRDLFHASLEPFSIGFAHAAESALAGMRDANAADFASPASSLHSGDAFDFAVGLNRGPASFANFAPLDAGHGILPAGHWNTMVQSPPHPSPASIADAPPGMADEIAYLNGIDGAFNVAPISFWTWDGNKHATYASSSDVGKWGADHATTTDVVTVNYNFNTASGFTAAEKGVFESCLDLWSAVTNVHFNLVTHAADADLTFKRGTDGSAYEFDSQHDSGGAGTIGGSTLFTKTSATISVDTSVPGFGPIDGDFTAFGGYVWGTLIHEMGHAIGLGHAGPYNGSVNPLTQQFTPYDVLTWTIMSYIEPHQTAKYSGDYPVNADWGLSPDGYTNTPTTWMPLDILAVQALYGTPVTTPLDGGQTFGFNTNITGDLKNFFDFTVNVNPVITIYSAGVGNTLDLSGFGTDSTVDLNPGTFSSCDGKTNNIAIAFGTTVETAIGGKGNDTFTANDDDDTLNGGRGSDVLTGGRGGDTLNGGPGADTLNGGRGADVLAGGGGDDVIVCAHVNGSTARNFDTVQGFDFSAADTFNLPGTVGGIDAKVGSGLLTTAAFNSDMATAVAGAQLAAGDAVLFKPDSGDYVGDTFLIVDANGTGGYQAGADFVFLLDSSNHIGALDTTDFI